jgi:hypothetical protein
MSKEQKCDCDSSWDFQKLCEWSYVQSEGNSLVFYKYDSCPFILIKQKDTHIAELEKELEQVKKELEAERAKNTSSAVVWDENCNRVVMPIKSHLGKVTTNE